MMIDAVTHTIPNIQELAAEVHAANVEAGWWSDLRTGESILATRNRGELLMLIVSELSEASEGAAGGLKDDKLPHLPMYSVELADTAIRLLDVIGAERFEVSQVPFVLGVEEQVEPLRRRSDVDGRLMFAINRVSAAMEHHRKARTAEYGAAAIDALTVVVALAQSDSIDLFDVIAQKRAFNATRADHQVANRRAAGGKAY